MQDEFIKKLQLHLNKKERIVQWVHEEAVRSRETNVPEHSPSGGAICKAP